MTRLSSSVFSIEPDAMMPVGGSGPWNPEMRLSPQASVPCVTLSARSIAKSRPEHDLRRIQKCVEHPAGASPSQGCGSEGVVVVGPGARESLHKGMERRTA